MNFIQAVAAARRTPSPSPGGIVTSGLVWHVDPTDSASYPGSGSTLFDLIGSNDGTFEGGTYVDANGYINLDGVNDAVNFGTIDTSNVLAVGPSSFSVNVWGYKYNSGLNFSHMYSQFDTARNHRVIVFFYRPQIRGIFTLWANGTSQQTANTGTNTSYNAWHMYTAVYDNAAATISIYVDGVLTASLTSALAPSLVSRLLRLGARGSSVSSNEFYGLIGAAMQYNRALSASEITQNFNATKTDYGL